MAKRLTVSLFVAFLLMVGGGVSAQTITSNGTGGGIWTATTTWQGGVVPTSANDVIIAGGDSVFTVTGVADSCNSMTIQSNAKFKNGDSTGFKVMSAFTIQTGGYYFNGNNTTSWPSTVSYTIDPASNYIQLANASSSIGASGNSTFGNLTIMKNGATAGANLTINGNLVVNTGGSGNTFRGSSASTGSLTHHVVGNVTIISGQWSCIDVGTAATTCIWNVDGNVTVGDPSTASAQSRLGPFSSASSLGLAIFNINGNLSFINGARLQGGSSSTAGTGTGIINLKGNLSIDNTCSQNTSNKIGAMAINFIGTSTQTVSLGIPLAGLAYSAYDTVAAGATVTFATGSRYWGLGGAGSPAGAFVVNGTLNLGVDTLKGTQNFILNDGATLGTSDASGFDAVLAVSGTKTLSTSANYAYNGSVNQVTGTLLPDTVNTLTAATADTLSFSDSLAATNVNVSAGTILKINEKVKTFRMLVSGVVIAADTLNVSDTATFNSGSIYNHAMDAGSLPSGKWDTGSTLEITGAVSKAPANGSQNFYNVIWNSPAQSSNLNLGWSGNTIGGDITVDSTGTGRWQLCAPTTGNSATVTINGNVNVVGGQFTTNGTGNGNTAIVIDHYGNINVTGGNFSISRGSQGGTGTSVWNLHTGNFSMSNATTQNSNATGAKFLFSKQGTQTMVLGAGNTLTALPIEVGSGTTLDLDTNVVAGSGMFTADSGATIVTRLATGFNGNLTTTGTVTLSKKANFTYNGKIAQVTGTFLPDTVNNLTIDDTLGVVLTKPTVINGVLTLKAGLFNNIIPFVLGPGGSIVYAGGRLSLPYNLSVVTIAAARLDANHDLIPDNLGDTLKVFGIVTSPNMGSTYTSYYIQDSTAGIDVYTGGGVMSFTVGDSVFVIGTIKQNRGLTEISPLAADSLHFWYLKHKAKVPSPKRLTLHQYVTNPENYEGSLIEVDSLYKASGTWGSGANIYLMNSSKADTAVMYINANTNVAGANEPVYPVNVIGIASQYSSGSTVYNNGYEIIPPDTTDIVHITIVGVNDALNNIPKDFYISQNYPNPFNPTTTISFGLPKASPVQIAVYNVLGQRVAVLADGKMEAGNHVLVFNGDRFASGVYFYIMQAGDRLFKQKMLLLK